MPLAAGTLNIDTLTITHPGDPCQPQDPCRLRLAVVSLAAANGTRYRVTTAGLTVTFTPRRPS